VQKIVLSVLVFSILVIGFGSIHDVYAQIDCTDAVLETNAFYVSSRVGTLHKVDPTTMPDPTSCLVGTITAEPGGSNPGAVVPCEDIAIDHSDLGKLYCLGFGTILYRIDRFAFDAPGGTVRAFEIAPITGSSPVDDVNAMEIDTFGKAYVAVGGGGLDAGNFYNIDLTTAVLTLRTAFGTSFISSGDLARDETTNTDMYWTVLCSGLLLTADRCLGPNGTDDSQSADMIGDDDENDKLYLIKLGLGAGGLPPTQDSLTPIAELTKGRVFAMDFVQPTLNLCYLNEDGFVFETDKNGVETKGPVLVVPLVEGFGASGNNVGGAIVMINLMSLALAATQTNAVWLILFAISGVAVIAYQFKGKTKSKNKKINV